MRLLLGIVAVSLLTLIGCETTEGDNKNNPSSIAAKAIPAYLNADSLFTFFSAYPLNFYFIIHDGTNGTFSRYIGYESRSIAESKFDGTIKSLKMEIMYNGETREIYRARIIIHNLKAYCSQQEDLEYIFHFISTFDSAATAHFKRNYKTVFCYNEDRSDSLEYNNEAKHLRIYVENDYDFSKEKKPKTELAVCVSMSRP